MNSEIIFSIKSKLKDTLKNKEVLDIILFGSIVKGKPLPNDIDIAIISNQVINLDLKEFHVSNLKPEEFFINSPSLVHTLLREGYSLKHNKPFSELYKFSSKVLFSYDLRNLNASNKVRVVNILRGKKGEIGLVKQNNGEWIANQVFTLPLENEAIFEKLFLNFNLKFNKSYILIH